MTVDYLTSTFMIMTVAVFGLRNVCALPISLIANWVLRLTQLRPTVAYLAATRGVLLLLGAGPAFTLSVLLALRYRPWEQVRAHLALLALLGWAFVEIAMIGFEKVPFTCSYLPGKANVQVVFWGAVFVLALLSVTVALYEHRVLSNGWHVTGMLVALAATSAVLWGTNRHRAKSALLCFDEPTPEIITTLGLSNGMRYQANGPSSRSAEK
jgi:hypothetical protein